MLNTEKELSNLEKQKKLSEYKGSDRVVPIKELIDEITSRGEEKLKLITAIPTFDMLTGGFRKGNLVIVSAPTGHGKCLGKGTPILMYDGNIKKVEDIQIGELIMGDDSTPRKILSLARGQEEMYLIKPTKGSSYVVNKSHVLSLKKTGNTNISRYQNKITSRRYSKGEIVDIDIVSYLQKSKTQKHILKGYRVGVNWKKQNVPIDPYFLGIWLGDGTSENVGITTADKEIVDFLYSYAKKIKHKVTIKNQQNNASKIYSLIKGYGSKNSLQTKLRKIGVLRNKHIPIFFKANDKRIRLKLLAGLIDSDGYFNDNGLVFVNKNKILAEDVCFLARSLGFAAYSKKFKGKIKNRNFIGTYYKVGISGELNQIPLLLKRKKCKKRKQKKDVLVTGVTTEPLGRDNYYGFEIDGNKRFLLGDFTVTHNTTFCKTLTKNFTERGTKSLWFSYEVPPQEFYESFPIGNQFFTMPRELPTGALKWIEERIIESKAKFNTNVVFIDHLHFLIEMKDLAIAKNQSILIGMLLRELKKIALNNDMIIFLVAHMKKQDTEEELPTIHDLRDSSFVAQESDMVLLLWRKQIQQSREEKKNKVPPEWTNESVLSVVKNRRTGKLGHVSLIYKPEKNEFIEYDLYAV